MKKTIGIVITIIITIVIAIPLGIWLMDIHSDRQQVVTTLQKVAFYTDWKCGLTCGDKNKVGEIPSGTFLQVFRIRYGKDYMAIKVIYNREKGWLIYSSDELELKNIVDS